MDADTHAAIEALKVMLSETYGDDLDEVILYGSHARGEATSASDIDIMIILDGEVRPYEEIARLSDAIYKIELKHGVLFSIAPISTDDYEKRRSPLVLNVRREGVPA